MSEGQDTSSAGATSGASQGDSSEAQPDRGLYARLCPAAVRRNYGAKISASLVLIVIVVALFGVVTVVQVQGAVEDDARADLETSALLHSTAVGEWVDGMRAQTTLLADSPRLTTDDVDASTAYLQASMDRTSTAVVGLHYVDTATGRVVASTDRTYRNALLSTIDRPWTRRSLLDRSSESVVVSERAYIHDDETVLAFAAPVSGSGRLILTATPNGSIRHGDSTTGPHSYVLNGDGRLVFASKSVDGLAETSAYTRASAGREVTTESADRLVSYAPVRGTDWVAVTAASPSTTGVRDVLVRNTLLLVVAVAGSLSIVAFVFGRRTVDPLVTLRERARSIEEGDLDVDLSTDRDDEIGQLYRAFASMRDALRQQVTEARQARYSAERSREEMERQNRRLDQFASTLSHDLRNPLAVARGHVELLDSKLDPEQDVLREHVGKIDEAHDRIDAIIDDVLTLTRKGESVDETERFALRGVAEEAWGNIDSKDATLTVTDSLSIEGDRSRLLRALENLFRNSLDHGHDTVSVTVGLTEDGFYVQDDGPGIPDDAIEDIFEYGHTTSDEGTGIGLSIVKTIAEAHGWSLWIDSTYESGARFVFADVFATEERIFEESAFTWDHASSDD